MTNIKLKIVLALLILLFPTTVVYAATWYDKLPESGEVAPKAGSGAAQPNYKGNVNFQSENPLDFSDSENNETPPPPGNGQGVDVLPAKVVSAATISNKYIIWPLAVVGLLVGGAVVYIASRRNKAK